MKSQTKSRKKILPTSGLHFESYSKLRRSPSLFVLSEPEKREPRWYLCHYLNIISGRRNLYLRYCCKSMMLH
ncbi:unnamed protein product [Brassica napus]|nr:unnamed protein product [Brassica napus]